MKIGLLVNVLSRDMRYDDIVDWAADQGVESLEVDASCSQMPERGGLVDVREVLDGGEARYTAALVRTGLSIGSLFYYGLNNLDPDPDLRSKAQEGLKDAIRAAAVLGARAVVTAVGSPLERHDLSRLNPWGIYYFGRETADGRRQMERCYAVFAENYLPLAEFAQRQGVRIGLEPSAVGGLAGAVAHSPEGFDAVFSLVQHEALGLNFDPSHLIWQGIDYMSYAARLAREGRIVSCHGKDTEILWERVGYAGYLGTGWWRHRLPGWGQVNWAALMATLQANGYNWVINVEHEDPLYGFTFGEGRKLENLELAKEGCIAGLEHLRHARSVIGR